MRSDVERLIETKNVLIELRKLFADELKKGYQDSWKCDEFIEKIYNFSDDLIDDLRLFDADYDFAIERYDDLMRLFNEQILPIDYNDYESIDYFMSNVKNAGEFVYVNKCFNYVENWEDVYEDWLKSCLDDIEEKIIDIQDLKQKHSK